MILLDCRPPIEVVKYIKDIQYNDIQYQDTKSVLCGYYCLYFLKRLDDGIKESTDSFNSLRYKIYYILYKDFDYKSPIKNEKMIKQFLFNLILLYNG